MLLLQPIVDNNNITDVTELRNCLIKERDSSQTDKYRGPHRTHYTNPLMH